MTFAAAAQVAAAAAALATANPPLKASLSAPGHTPKIKTAWNYTVTATRGGKPVSATLTVQIVDPVGGVHPVDFAKSTKPIENWKFRGKFHDFITWPADAAVGFGLTLRITVKSGGQTRVIMYKVTPHP
jgi:hypothetical protein